MTKTAITRREFVETTASVGAAMTLGQSVLGRDGQDGPKRRPNVLLVFSDQQHWQALGFVNPFFKTPHQDAIAKDSVVFDRSFCTTPQCSPSRSSLLTGFYPSTTGVWGNVGAAGGSPLRMPTLGKELQDAGYFTGYFGKWHLGDKPVATGGWDHHEFATDDPKAEANALDFLKTKRVAAKPFALFVSLNNPHDIYHHKRHKPDGPLDNVELPVTWEKENFANKPPIQEQFMVEDQGKVIVGKPRSAWQNYRDCYRKKTELYDKGVGRIVEELKRQGEWENTIVIITSDHGDMDAEHKLIFKGPFMYEHMMRIPLMIRVPKAFGGVGHQRIKDVDVVNVDIAPTLRELCGLVQGKTHGRSLASLLTGTGKYMPREFVIGQYYSKQRWVNPIRMIRTKRFKYNKHQRWDDELYDMVTDPNELNNLAKDPKYAYLVTEFDANLVTWMKDHDDDLGSQMPTDRNGKDLG